jgi:hypothetical protein
MSEGLQKILGITLFAALITVGAMASNDNDLSTTRNAAIPILGMGGEEEPPPPSDKALAKLEDRVNEMGEMILEISSQVENLTPAGAEGSQEGLEQLSSQVSDLVRELRRTNTRLVLARAEALLRDRGCEVQRGNEDEPWSCWYEGVDDWGNPFGGQFSYEDLAGADLHNASLERSVFVGADLRGTDFSGAYLGGVDFTQADLRGANFTGASLHGRYGSTAPGTNFTQADLTGADFTGATDIEEANFLQAILTDVMGLP